MKNEDVNTQIGARLRKAREEAGLSQLQLAVALDYESATAISLIEAGERKVKAEDLQKATKVLHRDIAYFVGQASTPDIRVALRADKELTDKDKEAVLHIIELAKQRHDKKR